MLLLFPLLIPAKFIHAIRSLPPRPHLLHPRAPQDASLSCGFGTARNPYTIHLDTTGMRRPHPLRLLPRYIYPDSTF